MSSKPSEADTSDDDGHTQEQDDSSFSVGPARRRLDPSESLPNSPASVSQSVFIISGFVPLGRF